MKEKQVKLPGPDHPIAIQRNPARVVVSVAGRVVADTRNALTLREAAYQPVQYIPGEDVDFSLLERTDHATYCPYKGECNYYSVPAGGKKSINAVWSYEDPFPAVGQIRGHVAFYPERVDEIAEQLSNVGERLTDWIITSLASGSARWITEASVPVDGGSRLERAKGMVLPEEDKFNERD